jgi:hypothetical protein
MEREKKEAAFNYSLIKQPESAATDALRSPLMTTRFLGRVAK